jgi:hypothetical protein
MDGQRRTRPALRRPSDVAVDRVAAELATRQEGIVQLLAAGVSEHAVDHRVRSGRLIPVFRGVYAVGHAALSDAGRLHAALMAAGPSATLSHRTAAALHQLTPSMPPFVEVTTPANPRRSRPGLIIHATRNPPAVVTVDRFRATAALRTLVDLAPTLTPGELERVCAEALIRTSSRPPSWRPRVSSLPTGRRRPARDWSAASSRSSARPVCRVRS